jgi:tetratricopeptide (TPR) repeat protein/transcriptional regulator with XRE-family HTH domain
VKKAADASPNRALKHERELRCWSQLELADRIHTTAFNVGRWERGITFPSAYFRQQLCLVFEKSPQALGFLPEAQSAEPNTVSADVSEDQTDAEDQASQPESVAPQTPEQTVSAADETIRPFIWNIPYRRNPFFTGREETLQMLHAAFNPAVVAPAQVLAISGLGGVGKTQTTIEYVYRYRDDYRFLLWARADTRELLITDFIGIATLLDLPERNDQNQSHAVTAVKRWLQEHTDWLLVLDNADDLAMVTDFLPETMNGGHILLTTRAQSTGQIAQRILVEKLNVDEGSMFLLRRAKLVANSAVPDQTYAHWSQARAIAEVMDGLPLALDQAAAYIEETGCGLAGYRERYRKHSMALLSRRGGLRSDHPEPVAITWALSFDKIAHAHPSAAELLRLCAFLHPDAIAEEIIVDGASGLTPHLDLLATDLLELDAAIGALTMFSLLRRDPDQRILTLHRLVQMVLREQMDQETQRLWAERAIQAVERVFPVVGYTTWQRCQQCIPHALACAELIEQLQITSPAAVSLLNKAGAYLRERAQYSEAEPLLTQALALGEITLAADAPLLADSLNNLGMLSHDQGNYAQAELLLQRALAIYEKIWGPEHIIVAQCLSNLAANYRVQTKHSQMEILVRRALAIREQVLGPDHPDVAKSLSQLASLYHGQGKYLEAEPLYLRTLSIRLEAFGSEHIDVAESLNNLAYLYHALGKYEQAEPLYQQALVFCEKTLGAQHMYTTIGLSNLAEVYRAQGKYERAELLHRRALEIRQQTLGWDHHYTGKSLNWLAEIYLAQQKYSEAEPLALQALEIWERKLGQDDYSTATGLDTLARLRRAQGDLSQAELLALRSLDIQQKIWTNGSQHVASSLNTVAEIFYDQKKYLQAQGLLHQALQIQEKSLSSNHPETARSLHNLALFHAIQGDYTKSEDYFARAFTICQHVLLPRHPDLVQLFQHYKDLLQETGNAAKILLLEKNMDATNSLV